MASSPLNLTEVIEEAAVYEHGGVQLSLRLEGQTPLGGGNPTAGAANYYGWRGLDVKQAIKGKSILWGAWLVLLIIAGNLHAEIPKSDKLLPDTTVAYVSVADSVDLEERLKKTQLGQFAQDASLQPFIDHLRESIPRRLGDLQQRVGVSLDDLQSVASGEMAWGLVGRDSGRAVSVLLVDTTGNDENRADLIDSIDQYLTSLNATKTTSDVSGVTITNYDVPPQQEGDEPRTAAYFVRDGLMCVADQREMVTEIATRLSSGSEQDVLAEVEEFQAVLEKASSDGDPAQADIRWFVRPFPMVAALRTIRPRKREGEDRVQQLRDQGFDAIKGVGGLILVASEPDKDFIHRTAIYAPASPDAPEGKKYRLGMNILRTPNSNALALYNWTPRMIARYTTINVDLLNAFDNVDSLFDTMVAGYPGAFKTAMDRFKDDPFGAQIDFRNEIVACLGTRICAMTDYTLPIETDSERFLVAIEVKPQKVGTLETALGKYLQKDGYIEKELEGRKIWEFQPEEEEEFDIGLSDGSLVPDGAVEDEEEKRLLTRSAVCVTDQQLFIASDVEFLRLAFKQAVQNEALAESYDYLAVAAALAEIAPKQQCSWSFTRTDESIRPTYALLRENRLPEGQSFFARLLNELLTSPADQKNQLLRQQRLDGSQLPSFELARRYFGPSGRNVRSDEDGWLITGVMLNKAEN